MDAHPPATVYARIPGRRVGDPAWPSPSVTPVAYALQDAPLPVRSPQHTGVDAGRLFPSGDDAGLPPDQREEDTRSACFEFEAPEETWVLGRPRVNLRLTSASPRSQVIARLCDVAPDGASTLATRGALNLSARRGPDRAVPWEPGTTENVVFDLNAIGHAFPVGHRIRLGLSSAYRPGSGPSRARRRASPWSRSAASWNSRYGQRSRTPRSPSRNRSSSHPSARPSRAPWTSPAPGVWPCATWPRRPGALRWTRGAAAPACTPTASNARRRPGRRTRSTPRTRCPPAHSRPTGPTGTGVHSPGPLRIHTRPRPGPAPPAHGAGPGISPRAGRRQDTLVPNTGEARRTSPRTGPGSDRVRAALPPPGGRAPRCVPRHNSRRARGRSAPREGLNGGFHRKRNARITLHAALMLFGLVSWVTGEPDPRRTPSPAQPVCQRQVEDPIPAQSDFLPTH
jgi:hypothetical protein